MDINGNNVISFLTSRKVEQTVTNAQDNIYLARRYLHKYAPTGITDVMISGIIGNLMQESRLNYTATNQAGYKGIAQWDPNHRYPQYLAWLKDNNLTDSLESQCRYIWHEPSRDSGNFISKFLANPNGSAADYAHLFNMYYERSGETKGDAFHALRLGFASFAHSNTLADVCVFYGDEEHENQTKTEDKEKAALIELVADLVSVNARALRVLERLSDGT